MKTLIYLIAICTLLFNSALKAECPLDHFIIGINEDGIDGTADDDKLFVDCSQKYRNSGQTPYANWFYPLSASIFSSYKWRIGEPGFDCFQADNPQASYTYSPPHTLQGTPLQNFELIIKCISISPGLRAVHKDYPQFTIDQAGGEFNHSSIHAMRNDAHMHMSYQAIDGENLFWITWQIHNTLEDGQQYESSEPFTIVFNTAPASGDLVVDGIIDSDDFLEFSYYWLRSGAAIQNDFFERADINQDGKVDLIDFTIFAQSWQTVPNDTF